MQNPSFREGSRSVLSPSHPERLDTWKEIASFFRREVRTVQLWEKHEDLPVHRQQHRKLGSIYAFRSELQAWWVARSAMSDARGSVDPILPEGSMPVGSCEPRFHMNAIEIAGPPDLAVPCRPDEPLDETHVDERERLARYACSMGTHYWKDRSRRAIQKAFRYFRDAVELNPTCAEAYAGLANVYISLSYNYMMPARDAGAKAHNAVQKALELDRTSTVVRNAAVNLLMNCVWDWAAAERECRDMFDAGALNTRTIQLYANLLNAQGRHKEAIESALQACRLEPLSAVANNQVAMAYFYSGDYESALPYSRRTLELTPKYTMGQALLGRIQAARGEWDKALSAFSEVEKNSAQAPFARALVAYAEAGRGDHAAAEQILQELIEMREQTCFPAYDISGVYSILNLQDEALRNITKACENRDMKAIFVKHDPRFTHLRSSSAFQQIAWSHLGIAS